MTTIEIVKIKNEYDAWCLPIIQHSCIHRMIWKSAYNAHVQSIFNKEHLVI